MRKTMRPKLKKGRIKNHPYLSSTDDMGYNGAFLITGPKGKLQIIASDQEGWEHVSVTAYNESRTPTWEEMCFVKSLFWDESELVIQYHPREKDYVNVHNFVLHLWKPIGVELPIPPTYMI